MIGENMDKRSFVTVQQGANVIRVVTNRSKAFRWLQDELISLGIDIDACKVRVSAGRETSIPRNCYYGAFVDLINKANPSYCEGVDIMTGPTVLYRMQRHLANGGE
jgi:hypothetical protein